MTDFTHKRAFMDGVKTGREQNSAERKILLERINKLEEQLAAEKLAAGYWMEQSCRDHNRAEKAEQQLSRYQGGVEVEGVARSRGTSYAGMDCYVEVQLPMRYAGQRVRVLVMEVE